MEAGAGVRDKDGVVVAWDEDDERRRVISPSRSRVRIRRGFLMGLGRDELAAVRGELFATHFSSHSAEWRVGVPLLVLSAH